MKKSTVIFALVLALLLACVPSAVYAMDNIGATDTVQPVTSVIGQSVEAMNYSEAPENLFPFIYSLAEEHTWTRENIIGSCDCTPGYLYVKNRTTGVITLIYAAETLHYTATQDDLYYVTANNTIMKTDFTGGTHAALYTASEPISELDYFEGRLCFLEGDTSFVLYDISSGLSETIELPEKATSAFLFATAKLLWSNDTWTYFCLDLITGYHTMLKNDLEVSNLVMPYLTSEAEYNEYTVMPSTVTTTIENDIDFPFDDFLANPNSSSNGLYGTAISHFWNPNNAIEGCDHKNGIFDCRQYGGSNQCDGFARYAHERFIHMVDWSRTYPYRPSNDTSTTTFTFTTDNVKEYFGTLTKGAFLRYSRDPSTDSDGHHSVVFVSADDKGVWVYEANQDYKCGVFYEYYNYTYIVKYQRNVVVKVNHSFTGQAQSISSTQHKTVCKNCAGYIIGTHNFNRSAISISATQHKVFCNGCTAYKTGAHIYQSTATGIQLCGICGYEKTS